MNSMLSSRCCGEGLSDYGLVRLVLWGELRALMLTHSLRAAPTVLTKSLVRSVCPDDGLVEPEVGQVVELVARVGDLQFSL